MIERVGERLRPVGRIVLRAASALALTFVLVVGVGPLTGAYRTVTVLTGSMEPGMPASSMAFLRPVAPEQLKVGDVVTYSAPIDGHPVITHRIVDIDRQDGAVVIATKGDASSATDPWSAAITSDVAWRQVAAVPHLGTVNRVARSEPVRLVSGYLVPALLLVTALGHIWARRPDDLPVLLHPAALGPHPLAPRRPPVAPGAMALARWALGRTRPALLPAPARSTGLPTLAVGAAALVAVPFVASAARRRAR